jgi:serine/threonine protein kinase
MEFFQVDISTHYFHLIMELQDGDVSHLARLKEFKEAQGLFQSGDSVGRPLIHQMLQALDYLESKDIIHRDVKPHNILYRRIGNSIHYRLADFGLATTAPHPRDASGTFKFMAPEVRFRYLGFEHTPKIDVWSLCASICWVFDLEMAWQEGFKVKDGLRSVTLDWNEALDAMAEMDPGERVSAGEVLTVMFEGAGRVTTQ